MQNQRILGFSLLVCIGAVIWRFPAFDEQTVQPKQAWQVQIKQGERVSIPTNELATLSQSELIKEHIRNGAEWVRTTIDFNEDSLHESLIYKPILTLQGETKPSAQVLQVHRFMVLNHAIDGKTSVILDLRADGIFEGEREIIPVKTPVFAYQIIQESIQKGQEIKPIIKVELLNSAREISSDQLVFYWDSRLKRIEATNAFDPEKAFN